jgi:dGTPase
VTAAATPPAPAWSSRRHDSAPRDPRSPFAVDRDRIVHCESFRELQYKTQVQSLLRAAPNSVFRTRLNHVIEVAQLARALARGLGADESLAEAIALAHDLGHPPFGHAGERALRAALRRHGAADWNANVHSLAVVDEVECSFIRFRGLDLTWATREGIARHSTPFDEPISFGEFAETPNGGIECQVVDAADVLAYLSHDLDDALAGGYVQLAELAEVTPLLHELLKAAEDARREHRGVWPEEDGETVVRRAVVARLISTSLADLVQASSEQAALLGADPPRAVRERIERTVVYTPPHAEVTRALLSLLVERYYRSEAVATADSDAGRLIGELFEVLLERPELVPERFRVDSDAVAVATYIASLNDRTATLLAEELGVAQAPSAG